MVKHKAEPRLVGGTEMKNYLCHAVPFPLQQKAVDGWNEVTCRKCLKKRSTEQDKLSSLENAFFRSV